MLKVQSMQQMALKLLIGVFLLGAPVTAAACTVCNSGTGKEVRAGIFNDFLMTSFQVLLPIPALGFCAWAAGGILGKDRRHL
jgi:hypothetical protein